MSTRRNERRERVQAKHYPEVFEQTEDEAIASDLAVNEAKATPAYYDYSDLYALNAQVQMERAL